jgi:O-antigen ligase
MTAINASRRLPALSARHALHAALLVLGLMWLLPFLVPYKAPPIPSFRAETVAVAMGLTALLALPAWAERLALPRVALLPAGFAGLLLLQTALGRLVYYQQGVLAALYLAWAAALMLLAALLRRELGLDRAATVLAWFLLAGLGACSVVGFSQHIDSYAFLGDYITRASSSRVWGNLAQPNHLADYMTLGLASLAYLFATGRLRLVYAVCVGVFGVYILSLTGARTPWLYLVMLSALAGAFYAGERSAVNRRLLVASLLALAGLYLIPVAVDLLLPSDGAIVTASERLAQTFSIEQRPAIFRKASLMFLSAPALGVGFRQFGIHSFQLDSHAGEHGFTDNAHNLILHVLAEFGVLGLLVLLLGAVPWVLGALRQPRTPALWWVLALAGVLAIHSMVEYPLWYAFFLGVAAIVLGLGEPRTLEFPLREGSLRRARLALWSTLLLGGLVFAQVVRDYLLLENFLAFRYRYVHASAELNKRAADMLAELNRTSPLYPWGRLALARTIHVSAEALGDKLAVNTEAMRVFPIDDVVYRQAMLLALAGEEEAARRQWQRAVVSFPRLRDSALLVLRRRVEDGVSGLAALLAFAEQVK